MTHVKGLDLSFAKAPGGWWVARRSEGFEAMSQCLDTGGVNVTQSLIPTAEENLMNALAAGLRISGYLNASPWADGQKAVQKAETVAGQAWAHIPVLFVDIEIDGVTQTRIHETCEAAKATGKAVAVYSARWFWNKLGNPQWPWLLEYGLWVADYDNDPNLATSALFGPWASASHKQYTNTTDVDGVSIDFDTFDLDLWGAVKEKETDMKLVRVIDEGSRNGEVYVLGESGKRYIDDLAEVDAYTQAGYTINDVFAGQVDNVPNVSDATVKHFTALLQAIAQIQGGGANVDAIVDELGERLRT